MQVTNMILNSSELYHMHWHARTLQNFVKYMQFSAVIISTAFESDHTADISLRSVLSMQTDQ